MKLIDINALLAEIERSIKFFTKEKNQEGVSATDKLSLGARIAMLEELKVSIKTLEVKEVDLEKEIDLVEDKHHGFESLSRADIIDIAKHFFKLGMAVSNKGQKGE